MVGEGKVDVTPDTASINAGISVTNAASVQAAQNQVDTINNKIIAEMTALGIEKKDIQTSNYSVNPNYNYDGVRSIDGYNANAQVSIKTQQLDLVSQIISKATEAGANEIYGVNFSIDDPSKFREQARDEAIANAKEQAKKLADQLGIELGDITNIVEADQGGPVPYLRSAAMEGAGGGGGPAIEPGTQTVQSTVTLFFEKK